MIASIKPHRDEIGLTDGLMLIDGSWVAAQGGQAWNHSHPATGEDVASFPVAAADDVDLAVRAARRAFDEGPWPRARANERIKVLRRIADLVREHGDELLKLQALDNSVPLSFGSVYATSAAFVADVFDHHAGWVDKLAGETLPPYQGGDHMVLTLREPVGVVGAIVPWNAPLLLFAQKVAPALAAGCTIVAKPSEYATFAVLRLAALIEEAGLPAGVLNIVTGPGEPTGDALIHHPMVDKLSFTGSRAVGRKIIEASADGFKRVSLELGGKSPALVFADADVSTAAAITMGTVTLGLSGQVCLAQTRALVQRDVADEFLGDVRDDRRDGGLRQPVRPGRHLVPADQHPADGTGARADRRRPGRRRPAGLRRHPQRGRPGRRATSSRPRCSPTCPTTCASPARRSSARCCP